MPLPLFSFFHTVLGADAKHDLFYVVLLGQCVVFALFGGLCNLVVDRLVLIVAHRMGRDLHWRNEQGELPYRVGLGFALVLWLFSGLVFLPLTGAGIFGAALVIGVPSTMFSLAIVGVAFGLLFIFIQNWLAWRRWQRAAQGDAETIDEMSATRIQQRRVFVRNGFFAVSLGALGFAAWRVISTSLSGSSGAVPSGTTQASLLQAYKPKITPPPTPNYGVLQTLPQQSSYITSNDQYYVVSKNLVSDPTVNGNTWNLTINGLVESPYTLKYSDLMALPRKQQYESMMCISNEVGGNYMSNALWEGIPLADLLQKAGSIKPGATKVVLYAADNYSDSIHLAKALEPTTLVAVKMNNVTLPQGHGYPARLLVPGIYGMKHVKWITRIEVVDTDYKGYWQQNGWSDPAPIKMTSRIDTPTDGLHLKAGQTTYVAGVAFSGNKGISEVDVSFDGGDSWQKATLQRPLSALTWVLWQIPWQPTAGSHTLLVRAIDMQGNVQDPNQAAPLPNGASGYHTVNATVA
jgi:DMSO/TMAO reductase YedYZ molybdopterin-dependent catalytic subunit